MGLFSDYVIYIKFKDGDEGYFVRFEKGGILCNPHPANAKKYSSELTAEFEIGRYFSDYDDIISYARVKKY